MDDRFFKTRTVTEIKKAVNNSLNNCAFISIVPSENCKPDEVSEIELVIGASYRDKCACLFGKRDLGELIDVLKYLHSVMK